MLASCIRTVACALALTATIATAQAKEPTTLHVGGLRVSGDLPIHIAEEKGYFKEAGLKVEFTRAAGPQMIQGLAAGKLDIVFVNTISILLAQAQGFDLVVVAPAQAALATGPEPASIWVKPDSPIRSAKDLAGKAIAINGLKNINWLYAREWLAQNGVDPGGVRFVEINFPQMPDALLHDQVDAAYGTEGWQSALLSQNKIRIVGSPFAEVQPHLPIALYVAQRKWAAENKETIQAFTSALGRAVRLVRNDPAEARRLWAQRDNRDQATMLNQKMFDFATSVDAAALARVEGLMKKHGLVDKDIDRAGMILPTAELKVD